MRITTTHLEDFIANLQDAEVYRQTVYFERSVRPLNGKTQRDATSFEVFYQTSAVLELDDGGQALLVCGVACGVDRTSAPHQSEGSEVRDVLHNSLQAYCRERGLQLRPGVLDQ